MGIYRFRLPDVGEGVTQAELAAWHVKPGDVIQEDAPLADVMTDKATVELNAPVAGSIRALHGEPGQRIAVGAVLVEMETESDTVTLIEPEAETATPSPAPAPAIAPDPRPPGGAVLAAPATRRRARELGLELETIAGSGPEGRILPADLHPAGFRERRIIGLRRKMAEQMTRAQRIPHFTYVEEIDMTALEALRARLNETGRTRLTLLPFFIRGFACLLPEFPALNARYDDETETLREYDELHAGIATQTENGLMVPVIRNAQSLDLATLAREISRLAAAAREGKAEREALTGSTITFTSLGALGGIAATPIINAPEVAILCPNRLVRRPVVRGGEIAIRTMMNLSASFDHRIIDGHTAARFIQAFRRLLEDPEPALAA